MEDAAGWDTEGDGDCEDGDARTGDGEGEGDAAEPGPEDEHPNRADAIRIATRLPRTEQG